MYYRVFILFLTVITLGFTSCQKEDETENGMSPGNIIVINEGNFGEGNGSLTRYNPATGDASSRAFKQMNNRAIDASIQSVSIYQNKAYIICNATDKIEVVNSETLEALSAPITNDQMVSPRYFVAVGNKAYISMWGSFDENFNLTNSKVLVMNLSDHSIIKMIDTDPGAEDVLAIGHKVFVANSFSNTIAVINTQTDKIDTSLVINTGPVQMELDQDNLLWVSTTGNFEGTPQLYQIDPDSYAIKAVVSMEGIGATGKFTLNADRDSLFLLGALPYPSTETAIYTLPVSSSAISKDALISGNSLYGIGIDPRTNLLYLGDANAFQGEGTVLRYHTNGALIDNFPAGIGPNGFVFP